MYLASFSKSMAKPAAPVTVKELHINLAWNELHMETSKYAVWPVKNWDNNNLQADHRWQKISVPFKYFYHPSTKHS